jgi:hypothetical protein
MIESIELKTRTLISCERDMVRGRVVVSPSVMHEAYHELKIWLEALSSSGQCVRALCEEHDVLVVIQTTFWMVDKPCLA